MHVCDSVPKINYMEVLCTKCQEFCRLYEKNEEFIERYTIFN